MVNGIDNIYLVNAPAGSGKTTWIRKQVEKHLLEINKRKIKIIFFINSPLACFNKNNYPKSSKLITQFIPFPGPLVPIFFTFASSSNFLV